MDELIDQVEARITQAIIESNTDSTQLSMNIALINSLTNLLSLLYGTQLSKVINKC